MAPSIERRDAGLGRGPLHGREQRRLAVVAALATVGDEALVVELAGLPGEMAHAEGRGQGTRRDELVVAVGLGDGGEGEYLTGAQHAGGERQHDARVDAAREGHAGAAEWLEHGLDGVEQRAQRGDQRRAGGALVRLGGHQPPVIAGAPCSANSGVDR